MRQVRVVVIAFFLAGLLAVPTAPAALAQGNALAKRIAAIAAPLKMRVGVGLIMIEDGRVVSFHGDQRFPMQSVFKLPVALAVLSAVDQGRLALEQEIVVSPGDLRPHTWSPLREKYPQGARLPLAEILRYTVAQSDNNGCDILLGLLGGPATVNDFIHGLGIKDMAIRYDEARMQRDWQAQFANWSTPLALARLLRLFYQGKILSPPSTAFLLEVMLNTQAGAERIKGNLPPGTPVAHKTGTSGTRDGVRAALNDVGIITLPSGGHLAVAVLVSDCRENRATGEKAIAAIARAAYDHFSVADKPSPAD
ncbi:class A beta-lactamase, subclass A2 [Desulfoferula mesophila]|uniref:class A beta-lactamase, subclass A2 n=1 Tax=Desulfoferula mesophila TaxID=3058419 RepID=UPI0030CEB0CE